MRFLAAVILALLLNASQAMALSLHEAIETALRNHQRIEQFSANAAESQAAIGTARAAFLPSIDLNYSYVDRGDDPRLQSTINSTLTLGASLNLFNGLSDYHRYHAALQRAQGADFRLRATRADIVLETQQAYIEVLRTARSVETATEGVKLLERQRLDAALQFEYGLIARNDLLRVEVELSSARQDLLQAKGRQQIARRTMERVIGLQLPTAEPFQDLERDFLLSINPDRAASYRRELLENRSELHFLRSEVRATKRDRRAGQGGYFPNLDISLTHEEYGDELTTTDNIGEDNLLSLHASWNLFDGFAREKALAAAGARVRARAAELRDTEAALVLQLETALQNARIAGGRQSEARSGVTQAEENYRVTENRYQQQQATTVDLLDAQFLLTRSRNLEIDARYDLYLSSAQLERILERDKE